MTATTDRVSAATTAFTQHYRSRLDDAAKALPDRELAAIVDAHAALGERRSPGEACVAGQVTGVGVRLQIVVDDQPWLVASLRALLARRGRTLRRFLHPILDVVRDAQGRMSGIGGADARRESFMHVELDPVAAARLPALEGAVRDMLATLARVREAREPLEARLASMIERVDDVEQAAFLSWLDRRQFVPFGATRVPLDDDGHPTALEDRLGLLADDAGRDGWTRDDFLPARLDPRFVDEDVAVIVAKTGRASPLIRDAEADLVIVATRDASGRMIEVDCLIGLFVPGLDTESVNAVPWMRDRVNRVVAASGLDRDAHDGKALVATLRSLPRDMLLQTRSASLLEMARGIADVQQQRHTRVFSSADPLGRYWNCLVYLPNDAYTRDLRLLIERRLERGIDGFATGFESIFSSTSPLARIHFVIRTRARRAAEPDWQAIEADIASATVSWAERLERAVADAVNGESEGESDGEGEAESDGDRIAGLIATWGNAFPTAYREHHGAERAMRDLLFIDRHLATGRPAITPVEPVGPDEHHQDDGRDGAPDVGTRLRFRLHSPGRAVALSEAIPLFENLGFRVESERPFELTPANAPAVHTLVFTVRASGVPLGGLDGDDALADLGKRLQGTFADVSTGRFENDGFNRLVYAAGLSAMQANLLRSLAKYLIQARAPFSIGYIIDALVAQPAIARALVTLFETRLDPATEDAGRGDADGIDAIERALDGVTSLDEDRILRRLLGTLLAVLRTNYWRRDDDGATRAVLSFKFDCAQVPGLPLPRPKYEIFVASANVDGVHLRGGDVARGGLRWSDRREDYRTEVLGLMKAQMVKNAVIVPVGSKGGFYVKAELPAERSAAQAVVVECYRHFLSGLLDVTDDLVVDADAPGGSRVVPPPDVARLDGDDPYLVVAADKGTATFSDHANRLAEEYGFWLGDAFASGGSAGYDHKRMGITARGAWESVKRHFRGLGLNTQTTPFTVVGIGDMAGDVFGNGMLLSKEIRLVAAFNHLHVFIDPQPPTHAAWAERQRLFDLPRSSWDDYDRSLISPGGGIWSRAEKRIELSREARDALGIADASRAGLTPDELISAILRAPVDLLWNGGIGTYVKASAETQADAADRANDAVRVDGAALRCQVIGEGGNLGLTQRGRIEFALHAAPEGPAVRASASASRSGADADAVRTAGRVYTDAIDNAAGVDCSDHEVNIKILLNAAIAKGRLERDARDALLESMTDEVALLVLRDNYLQTECVDVHHADGLAALPAQAQLMETLEAAGQLDRELEYLPDAETLAERVVNGTPLTRPEIAVLVSYAKMTLYEEVLASGLPDRPERQPLLRDYFPGVLGERFADEIAAHRLAREIVATVATNEFVNRLGPTFGGRMQDEFGVSGAAVVDAFLAVRETFDLDGLYKAVESLDNVVTPAVQLRMLQLVRGLGERATHWVLRTFRDALPDAAQVARWREDVASLNAAMPDCLSAAPRTTHDARVEHFVDGGAPRPVAERVSAVVPLSSALDLVEIAHSLAAPVGEIAALYFSLGEFLDLHWLRDAIAEIEAANPYHLRARSELRSDLHYQHRHLAAEIAAHDAPPAGTRLDAWADENAASVARYRELVRDIRVDGHVDFVTLSLAVNELHKLLRSRRPLGG